MNFAVIENNIVINTILADSKEIAEEVTGKTCIEYLEENPAGIGWEYNGTMFIVPESHQPIPSDEPPAA